jgi:hypothetical protein
MRNLVMGQHCQGSAQINLPKPVAATPMEAAACHWLSETNAQKELQAMLSCTRQQRGNLLETGCDHRGFVRIMTSHNARVTKQSCWAPPAITSARRSAGFCFVGAPPVMCSFIATNSLQQWQQKELDFFFDFWTRGITVADHALAVSTDKDRPSIDGTPVTRNLRLRPLAVSTPFFMVTNLAPKTEFSSMVSCCFENRSVALNLETQRNWPLHKCLTNWALVSAVRIKMRANSKSLQSRGLGVFGGAGLLTLP